MGIERKQAQNKKLAIQILTAKLAAIEEEKRNKEISGLRKDQVGTGGRSEKIRTYNYKDSRVTDHRLGQNFGLDKFFNGNLQEPTRLLRIREEEEKKSVRGVPGRRLAVCTPSHLVSLAVVLTRVGTPAEIFTPIFVCSGPGRRTRFDFLRHSSTQLVA